MFLTFVFGCKTKELPKEVLPKVKMAKVLIDIHIAEAKVNHLRMDKVDSGAAVYLALQDSVFKENKISQETYIESFRYYRANPALLDEVYAIVVDSLSLRHKILKLD